MSKGLPSNWKAGLAGLAGMALASSAFAIQTAGTLFVDLDARHASAGTANWANSGSLGGSFAENGNPLLANIGPKASAAVSFDGVNDFYRGPAAPAGLTGAGPAGTRSIEVWAFNPAIPGEETLVSLAKRGGPNGSNVAFNYGSDAAFGAVGHWANADIGWNGAPAANQWHHLVYTFDGVTTRVYSDGVLKNIENSTTANGGVPLDAHDGIDMLIASQMEPNGTTPTGPLRGSLSLGQVRVHDGVLSDAQIISNFGEEVGRFVNVAPSPPPNHRYSFNGNVNDSIGGANGTLFNPLGTANFSGGMLNLNNPAFIGSGNPNAGNFVDLPVITTAGKSALSLEVWGIYTNAAGSNWSRIFDFGNEVSNTNEGREYVLLTPQSGLGDTRLGIATPAGDIPGFNAETDIVVGGTPLNNGQLVHVVATFDDGADVMKLYINGQLISQIANARNLVDIDYAFNHLGRSLYDGDAYLQGSFDEFRIYHTALNDAQVLGNFAAGPNALNLAQVPEPASVVLGLIGVGTLTLRRRRAA